MRELGSVHKSFVYYPNKDGPINIWEVCDRHDKNASSDPCTSLQDGIKDAFWSRDLSLVFELHFKMSAINIIPRKKTCLLEG